MHKETCMYKVNFACLFFGYLNRNSHGHEHFTCTGTLPVPVHRYRGILRSLFTPFFCNISELAVCILAFQISNDVIYKYLIHNPNLLGNGGLCIP